MTAKQKIIAFMKWKQERIQEVCGEAIPYFIEEDEAAINSWDDLHASNIWAGIVKNVLKEFGDYQICPFCIRYYLFSTCHCSKCEYRSNHGKCESDSIDNTYGHILKGEGRNHGGLCDILKYDQIRNKIKELDAKADK